MYGYWQPFDGFQTRTHSFTHTIHYSHMWMEIVSHYANSKATMGKHFAKCCGFFDNFTLVGVGVDFGGEGKEMANIKEENIHSSLLIHLNIFAESTAKTKFAICENYNFHVSIFLFCWLVKCFLFIFRFREEKTVSLVLNQRILGRICK